MRIYTDGVFDLLHYGHMRLFEWIKKENPGCTLVVGIHGDEDVILHKRDPVLKYEERRAALSHVRWVDEVVERAPWKIDEAFVADNRIDIVCHDSEPYPYAVRPELRESDEPRAHVDLYEVPRNLGIFRGSPRTPGISTSEIIRRVQDASPHAS
jgi:choline-phosphate cytidylyltransferase